MRKVQCKFDSLAVGNHLYRAWRDRFFFFFTIFSSHISVLKAVMTFQPQ